MCGLIGIYFKNRLSPQQSASVKSLCEKMLDTLQFRGPDEKNLVQIGSAFLGHTRLSIIDLVSGSQPIFNEDKSVAVILNGEIYNFRTLRDELIEKGHQFSSKSDTEVIVHLYEEVGENVFSRLTGMFSIVIYDHARNLVLAGRDRIGEKPLIYQDDSDRFIAASELKALLQFTGGGNDLDPEALSLYLNCMYIPAPLTIFRNFKKLLPGHYIKVSVDKTEIKRYWSPQLEVNWDLKEDTIIDEFRAIFFKAVEERIVADVPLGVFLSGGMDSSAVTAVMAQCCPGRIKTFSLGFADEIDERPYAKLVADRYQTDHTEILIRDRVDDVFAEIIGYYDEPFGDSSAIPTYLVSREARKHVKVILTGDGGDELFAGYDSYKDQQYQLSGRISTRLLREVSNLFNLNNNGIFDILYPRFRSSSAQEHWLGVRSVFNDVEIARLLNNRTVGSLRYFQTNQWLNFKNSDALSVAFAHDLNFYLPDDLLKKVDMASMRASIECRAPFLDHSLIEFCMKIPPQMKLKNNNVKYLMKRAFKDDLPAEILTRPKHGFGAPVESWLRKPLRKMTLDYLASGCKLESLIDRNAINSIIDSVYKTKSCEDYRVPFKLWLILILEAWMRTYCN